MSILAAFLDIGINLLFVAVVLITLLLLVVILMQRPKQEGLGAAFGAALTDQAFGARTTDVLKKATVYLGTAFMVCVLLLTILMNRKYRIDGQTALINGEAKAEQTVEEAAKAAEQKEQEAPKSLSDLIEQEGNDAAPAPEAPAQPAGAPAETPAPADAPNPS